MITSKKNESVKKVLQLKKKNVRSREKLILLEGERLVSDALRHGLKMETVFVSEHYDVSKLFGMSYVTVSAEVFSEMSETLNPQGIIAVAREPEAEELVSVLKKRVPILFFLDRIQDPGNLGAMIRSADAFGIPALILNRGTVDPYNSKVIRATMGSLFRTSLIFTEDGKTALTTCRSYGYSLVGTTVSGGTELNKVDFLRPSVIIIGNEANGVEDSLLGLCDEKMTIRMNGNAESLNAAVATSIIMYVASLGKYHWER